MKSAYEIAMERFGSSEPIRKLTDDQRKALAEIDSLYDSKIAEREVLLKGQMNKARAEGDYEAMSQLEKQMVSDRKTITNERERKKEAVRNAS